MRLHSKGVSCCPYLVASRYYNYPCSVYNLRASPRPVRRRMFVVHFTRYSGFPRHVAAWDGKNSLGTGSAVGTFRRLMSGCVRQRGRADKCPFALFQIDLTSSENSRRRLQVRNLTGEVLGWGNHLATDLSVN